MNDLISIIESLEDLVVSINSVTETIKNEIKKEGEFLSAVLAPLVAVVKGVAGRGFRRA